MTQHSNTTSAVVAEIRAAMGRRDCSRVELSKRVGISQTGITRRLNGQVPINLDELAKIAAALAVPVTELVAPLDHDRDEQVPA